MKTQRKHSGPKVPRSSYRSADKSGKKQAYESKLGKLYARLDQTKPGSKQSREIADEIIDAIG